MAAFLFIIVCWWFFNGRSFKIPQLVNVDLKNGAFTTNNTPRHNFLNGSPVNSEIIPFLARPSATSIPLATLRTSDLALAPLRAPAETYAVPTVTPRQDPWLKKLVNLNVF
jgi:hypothetical protein